MKYLLGWLPINDLIIIIGVYSLEMSYNQLPCDGQR